MVSATVQRAAVGPWWRTLTVQVLALYAVTRLVSAVMLAMVAPEQLPAGMTGGQRVGYLGFTKIWDGEWYERIARTGYPHDLPVDAAGQVQQNPWAFYPLFPLACRALMALTGLPFEAVGSTLALVLGGAAAVVMARMLAERVGKANALLVVLLYAVFPASPALQLAYTESLAMLLLCGYLWALSTRRWLVATGLALLVGVSRPIALPLALVTLLAVWLRWRQRRAQPVDRREAWSALAALLGCGVAGLLWPAVAWAGTGRITAYTDTMGAWSAGGQVRWFVPWIWTSQWLFGSWGPWVLAGLVVAMVAAMAGPWAARLGPELRGWSLAYPAYVMTAQGPGTSTPRYLLMMFPYLVVLVGVGWARQPRMPLVPTYVRVVVFAAVFLVLQWMWVSVLWLFTPPSDWAP